MQPKKSRTASPPASARDVPRAQELVVVGLGASAGGLQPLDVFFSTMPTPSMMAYVVITHQPPDAPSVLRELIARRTPMTVVEVVKRTRVEPDHVYLPRPGFSLTIAQGVLTAAPLKERPSLPIDIFFRSLAADRKRHAVGIVLSGTGSDGTAGCQDIKSSLGLVLAQDEATAQFSAMPASVIGAGVVDFVLPVGAMIGRVEAHRDTLRSEPDATERDASEALHDIYALIRARTGHDFSQYKVTTMRRRIERRMSVQHLESEGHYLSYLQEHPTEIDLLFKELLIHVTSFFRDPEAWDALGERLQSLLATKPRGYVFRAWIPGCSTGQEAYSLAIVLRDLLDDLGRAATVQIFATDLDLAAIELARAGVYPLGIAADVTPKRIAQHFTQEEEGYRIKQDIREMVVFAPQNVISDPPFTKLDFVSCRNLLIYLESDLQKKLLPLFHYALKTDGLLFLGSSESVGTFGEMFSALEKKAKLFKRRDVPVTGYADLPARRADAALPAVIRTARAAVPDVSLGILAERTLARDLIPPTVLVNERGDVVHILGRTGQFLELAPGPQGPPNLFTMAREGLQVTVAAAIRQALVEDEEVIHRGVELKVEGESVAVDVRVRRLKEPELLRGLLRVSFLAGAHRRKERAPGHEPLMDRVTDLERELQYTRETQQSTLEQLETANEELKSTNEEMQSTNEELQSTNEELETSKEEMQSLNEELQTVNAELQEKVEELSRANNDMKNLLNGTNIATIFLDNDLHIKRYTDQAKKVIRLIPSDVGRPIGDLVSSLRYDHLVEDARGVLQTLVFKEAEVRGDGGACYLMRILPYRTVENVIDGLVLTFVEITALRAMEEEKQRLLDVLARSRTRAFGHDQKLRYMWVSGEVFGREPAELQGKTDAEVFGAKAAKTVTALKTEARDGGAALHRRVSLSVDGVARSFLVYAEPSRDASGQTTGVSCVATDVTDEA